MLTLYQPTCSWSFLARLTLLASLLITPDIMAATPTDYSPPMALSARITANSPHGVPNVCTNVGYDHDTNTDNNNYPRTIVYSVDVNSSGVIGVAGSFAMYDGNTSKNLGFLQDDFAHLASHLPAEVNGIDTDANKLIAALPNGDFLMLDSDVNFNEKFYRITSDGTRTPFAPQINYASKVYVSKLGDYAFVFSYQPLLKIDTSPNGTGANVPGFSYTGAAISDITEQPDGKLLVTTSNGLIRLNANGSQDNTFTSFPPPPQTATLYSVRQQSDGKIVVAGAFSSGAYQNLARLHPDGSVDESFVPQTTGANSVGISQIVINQQDEIFARGPFKSLNNSASLNIAKFHADGTIDDEFIGYMHGGLVQGLTDMVLQEDGKLLLAGAFYHFNNVFHAGLMRLHRNGMPDTEINNTPYNIAHDLGVNENDPIVTSHASKPNKVFATKAGLIVGNTQTDLTSFSLTSSVSNYDIKDASNFNAVGYQSEPVFGISTHQITDLDYDPVNNRYFVLNNCPTPESCGGGGAYAFKADGTELWHSQFTTQNMVSFGAVSPDGDTYIYRTAAADATVYRLYVVDTATGNLITQYTTYGGQGIDFHPTEAKLYEASYTVIGYVGNPVNLINRMDYDGSNFETILLDDPTLVFAGTINQIKFFSDTGFYIYHANPSNGTYLSRYTLVTSTNNLTPNPQGTYAIRDPAFNNGEVLSLPDAEGKRNGFTVVGGIVYLTGGNKAFTCNSNGFNIISVSPTGTVDNDFIEVAVNPSPVYVSATGTPPQYLNAVLASGGSTANNPPVITFNGGGSTAIVSAAENSTGTLSGFTVTATDPDADVLTYALTGGADKALFNLNPATGKLTFITPPDFETPKDADANNTYLLEVTVSDGKGGTDVQMITFTVTNTNEDPTITSNSGGNTAALTIAENTTAITTVTATDPDAANTLTYTLTGGADKALFTLDAATGVLTFTNTPDFEAPTDTDGNNTYLLEVTVSDGNGGSDIQTITVTVTNVNEAPAITSNSGGNTVAVNVAENTTAITTITATDPDAADMLTYTLSGGVDKALFTLNPTTGALAFITALDFEAPTDADGNNTYLLEVTVSDGNGGTDMQTITLTVTNANEAPTITSNSGGNSATVNVAENTTAVTTVTATDPDAASTLTYTLSGGADKVLFTLNPTTGVLTFITASDFEAPTDADKNNTYLLEVTVSDGNGGTDTQSILVTVTDDGLIKLQVRALLQGAYDRTSGLMLDTLRSKGVLPVTQPYSTAPFLYMNTETLNLDIATLEGKEAVVDWMLVDLRDAAQPTTVLKTKAVMVQRDGDLVDAQTGNNTLVFNATATGSYYVSVRHRNHLGVMTAAAIPLTDTATLVDFMQTSTPTYGTQAQIQVGNIAMLWGGDASQSQQVIANGPNNDPSILLGAVLNSPTNVQTNSNFQLDGYYATDVTMDGKTLYAGPNNDINLILGNVLLHPGNTVRAANFVINGGIPK